MFFILGISGTLVSGLFTIAAFPGSPVPWAAWVCMVPWLIVSVRASAKRALFFGLVYGILYAIPCTWNGIYNGVEKIVAGVWQSTAVTVLFFLPYILPFGIFGFYLGKFKPKGIRGTVSASALLVSLIYIFPTVFPVTPGLMLHRLPRAIQLADIGGVPLINFCLFFVNFLLADLFRTYRLPGEFKKNAAALAASILLIAGYGTWGLQRYGPDLRDSSTRTLKVLLIQPNIPAGAGEISLIWDRRGQSVTALELTRRILEKHPDADIALWPETPVNITCGHPGRVADKLSEVARKTGVSFLYRCNDCGDAGCSNSAKFIPADGGAPAVYHKRALMPFYEEIPQGGFYALFAGMIPQRNTNPYVAGSKAEIFRLIRRDARLNLMPLICYDVHFPEFIREAPPADAFLVLANNQVFGKSRIGYLDYAMNIFRAVEFRRPLFRVTNTGPSGAVGADGLPFADTPTASHRSVAMAVELVLPEERPLYGAIGNIFLHIFYLAALADLGFRFSVSSRKPILMEN